MTITQSSTRLAALTLGVAAIVAVAFGAALATPAHAANICPGTAWNVNLKIGSTGSDVMKLQQFLNMASDTQVAASGIGSAGMESSYYGALTGAAVAKFQLKYRTQILAPLGLTTPTTNFFASSRAQAYSLCAGGTVTPPGTTYPPVTGNGLKVMLSTDSPNNVALVQGQAAGDLAHYTFSNPTSAPVMVTSLAFKRIGTSNDTTLVNVYLFNGAVRITDSAGVSNSAFNFNNPSGLFTIPAGGTYTVAVRADILTGTSGQQLGAQLVSVASNGTLDSSVVFPISSYLQTISAATLSTVDFNTTTLPSASAVDAQADYTVWQNTVTVGTRSVLLKSFALRNIGSVQTNDIRNFRLYVDGTMVGTAVASMDANSMITFDLSANPVLMPTGGRVIKVLADIVGGASRTFSLSLRYPSDAIMVDTNLNQPILPTANGSTFSARTATTATINSISSSVPSVTRAASSPTSNVSVGATTVKWATFNILPSSEDIKVDNFNIKAVTSNAAGLQNGQVFLNGVQVGSTKNLTNNTDVNFTFGSSMILKANQVAVIDIYADAKGTSGTNLPDGTTATTSINSTSASNAQGQISLSSVTIPSSIVTGNTITVTSASLTATKASGYGNQTIIAGSSNAKIGSFTLSAGSTEGVNINTIDLNFASAVTATLNNLVLKDVATGAVLGTKATVAGGVSTGNTYSVNVLLPVTGSKTIDVYADVKTAGNVGALPALTVTTSTTGTGQTTGTSVAVVSAPTLQTITIATTGTLSGSVSGNNPVNANIIAGGPAVKVGQFTFSSQNSPFTIQQLNVEIPSGAASSVQNVMLKVGGTQVGGTGSLQTSASLPMATSSFQGLSINVPANNSTDVEVWVTPSADVTNNGVSGIGITALLSAAANTGLTIQGFKAVDAANNTITTFNSGVALNSAATSGYGTMYLKRSFPTFTKATSGLQQTVSSGQPVYKFNVTADAAGTIDWNKISFTVSTTSVTASGFILYDVTGGSNTAVSASTEANASNIVAITTNATGNIQQVGAGTTKTYQLVPTTVSGWGGAGDQITVAPTVDSTAVVNAAVSSLSSSNMIWSDRSASAHISSGTSATDWTNGYLVKDMTSTATYSCQFGTATTCQ